MYSVDWCWGLLTPKRRAHYIEYVGKLIFERNLDTLDVMDDDELESLIKQASIRLPSRLQNHSASGPVPFRRKMLEVPVPSHSSFLFFFFFFSLSLFCLGFVTDPTAADSTT